MHVSLSWGSRAHGLTFPCHPYLCEHEIHCQRLGERDIKVLADTHPCVQEKVPQEGLPTLGYLILQDTWSIAHGNLSWRVGSLIGLASEQGEVVQLVKSIGSIVEGPCSTRSNSSWWWLSKVLYVFIFTRCNMCTIAVPWHEMDMDTTRTCHTYLLQVSFRLQLSRSNDKTN